MDPELRGWLWGVPVIADAVLGHCSFPIQVVMHPQMRPDDDGAAIVVGDDLTDWLVWPQQWVLS